MASYRTNIIPASYRMNERRGIKHSAQPRSTRAIASAQFLIISVAIFLDKYRPIFENIHFDKCVYLLQYNAHVG